MAEIDTPTLIKQLQKALPHERIKLRDKLLARMNPELRSWFDEAEKRITAHVQASLIFYWTLGKEAKVVHRAEKKFGPDAIQLCAGAFQEDVSVLYKAMKFHSDWDEAEFQNLLSLRMKHTGRPIMWSHIVVLAQVANKAKRNQYLQKVLQNNWNHNELLRVVKQDMETKSNKSNPASGRKPYVPGTVDKMLHHMDTHLAPVAKKFSQVYNSEADGFLRLVQKTDPSEYRPAMVDELDRIVLVVQATKEGSIILEKQLLLARKKIVQSLNKTAKEDGEAEAEALDGNGANRKKKPKEVPLAVE